MSISSSWTPSFPAHSLRELDKSSFAWIQWKIRFATLRYQPLKYAGAVGGGVVRVGTDAVLKYGPPLSVQPSEAAAMEYIAQHTTIPVPRVRDVFKTGKFTWIEMDYINGRPLLDVWPTLTQAERTSCIRQLKGYVDQLRALPPPHPQRVQAVDGGSSFDLRLLSTAWGPFDSIAAFNQCMGHEFALRRHPELQSMFDRVAGRHWRIVFTHGDMSPQNILWRDGRIVGIIDWSYSGWFPEYWEYTRTWLGTRGAGESFWEMFRDSVDAYPDELEIEQCLGQVLNHDP